MLGLPLTSIESSQSDESSRAASGETSLSFRHALVPSEKNRCSISGKKLPRELLKKTSRSTMRGLRVTGWARLTRDWTSALDVG